MKCPYCQEENIIDSKFCAECGKPLSKDLPSYLMHEDDDLWKKLKEIKEDLLKAVTEKNYREILSDKRNPITNMLIVFVAWLILRTIGIIPFIIIVRILAFLMGYAGLVFLMAMTYVYTTHQKEIMEKVEEIRGIDYKKTIKEIVTGTIEKIEGKPEEEQSEKNEKTNEIEKDEEEEIQ